VESGQTAIQGQLIIETNKLHEHVADQEAQVLDIASLIFKGHNFDIGIHVGNRVRLGTRLLCERRGLRWVLGGSEVGTS
jgi:hypothetical protein